MALSPGQAQLVLDKSIANLARKVAEGGILTDKEFALVQAAAGGGTASGKNFAHTQNELGEILHVDRKTIQRWLKIDGNPGKKADGRYDIAQWRAFAAARGHEVEGELDTTQLRAENLLLSNEHLRIKIAEAKRENVPRTTVEQWGGELGAAVRKVVCQIHLHAPGLAGLSVPEIDQRLKEIEDEVLLQLNSLKEKIDALKTEAVAYGVTEGTAGTPTTAEEWAELPTPP